MGKKISVQSKRFDTSSLDDFQRSFRKVLDDQAEHPENYDFLTKETVGNPVTLGPAVIAPEDWAAKQIARASAAADDWLKGVKRPRKNPVEAAIKANDKRKDRLAEAEKADKWRKKMGKVNLDEMYDTIEKVGAGGYRAGVEARTGKITRVAKELQPMVAALRGSIDAMSDATDADREKRLLAARRGMIEIGKKRTA